MPRTEGEISRRDFFKKAGRDLGAVALLAGNLGSFGAFLTENFRLGPPEQLGQLNPEAISTAVRALGLQAVNLFLKDGSIINSVITTEDVAPQGDIQMHYFTSDKYFNNFGQGVQLTGGYNRQTDYGISFALPDNDYTRIMAAGGNNRNVEISSNLAVLSMSIIGGNGFSMDNEMLLDGRDWIESTTRYLLHPTTDPSKLSQAPDKYRAFTVSDLIQFYSDIDNTLAVF